VVKKVAGYVGVSMTKKVFASGVAKAIPIVGAVFSGSLTLATFLPMSKRLQKHLASLELTKPDHRVGEDSEVVNLEVVEELTADQDDVTSEETAGQADEQAADPH